MFQGFYSSMNYEPIADFGAHSILGMGGSLSSYIKTGNPYDKNYYPASCNNKCNKDVFCKSDSNKTKTIKVLGSIGLILASSIALFTGVKNAKITKQAASLFNTVKSKSKSVTGFFEKGFESVKKSFNKLKSKI